MEVSVVEAVVGLRSERELLRFRRTFTMPFVDMPRMEDKDGGCSCALFGRDISSCEDAAVGRSREPGRQNGPKLASTSIDLERNREPLVVPDSESPDPLLLLRVRNIEETLLSPSCFDPSRCKLNPNRFRKEDALEPTEPAFCDADLV